MCLGSKLTFALEYMTSPAHWAPEYDMRLLSPSSPTGGNQYEMRIGLYAVVSQETQEDWNDVSLHLSTAQPQPNIYPPAPPARLSINYQPEHPSGGGQYMMKKSRAQPEMFMAAGMAADTAGVDGSFFNNQGMESEVVMNVAGVGISGSGGNMGAAVVFSPKYPVNITSNYREQQGMGRMAVQDAATRSTRLFIKEMVVAPSLFTYIVPTAGGGAHLKAWTTGSTPAAAAGAGKEGDDSAAAMPLLESPTGRVFIDGAYTGTTSVPSTQPGGSLRLDLGQDRNIEVHSTFVMPRKGSETEDKSTWFVTDKVFMFESISWICI